MAQVRVSYVSDRRFLLPKNLIGFYLALVLLSNSCSTPHPVPKSEIPTRPIAVKRLGYTIQAGAFKNMDNAVKFTHQLSKRGLWAFYFLDDSGFYKVRFGNFPTKDAALSKAKHLVSAGVIRDFYIISPCQYPVAILSGENHDVLREQLVKTARNFIGVPYRWGGESPEKGFDCSGFTMAVYRLNGLMLPRSSWQQWNKGLPVTKGSLKKGDLVFFATNGRGKVSHVGIYVGKGKFIHAPGKGKQIKIDSLENSYFRTRYVGAKRYL